MQIQTWILHQNQANSRLQEMCLIISCAWLNPSWKYSAMNWKTTWLWMSLRMSIMFSSGGLTILPSTLDLHACGLAMGFFFILFQIVTLVLTHFSCSYISYVEWLFSCGHNLLTHIRNQLSSQSVHALLCLGSWSLLGIVNILIWRKSLWRMPMKRMLHSQVDGMLLMMLPQIGSRWHSYRLPLAFCTQ